MLHELLSVFGGIQTGSTRRHGQILDAGQLVPHLLQTSKLNFISSKSSAKSKSSSNSFGLLDAFLQCPVRIGSRRKLHFLIRCLLHPSQVQSRAISPQHTNLAIVHADEVFRVSVESRSLRGDKRTVGSNSNDKRGSIPRHHQLIRAISAHYAKSPRSIASRQSLLGGFFDRFALFGLIFVVFANELGNYLCISLAVEMMTPCLEFSAQLVGIVESPVVNESNFS
mmetsp:Transcript_2918/g.5820  ORF Transcript_2918/g.5820 Transcript_2918/m.5820 type:complete len:225 (-) Transcript_2918:713-1387(-)